MGGEVFSFEITKDHRVRVFWEGRCVMTLGGQRGRLLAAELADASHEETQYALQIQAWGRAQRVFFAAGGAFLDAINKREDIL